MSSLPQSADPAAHPGGSDRARLLNAALWLIATAIAVFFATVLNDSAMIGGEFIPRTNDSLYHARRILDTAFGERGFYQFDQRLQVPEGTWIPWPWAYDYLLAQALKLALLLKPGLAPMAFLAYVPVFWLGINSLLFLACANVIGLSASMRTVAMLAFACSPLVQLNHATAMIDHHFIELSFVLLSIWLGLRFLRLEQDPRNAILLGLALGIAPAFHNGLFMLQLPLLAGMVCLWFKGRSLSPAAMLRLGVSLFAATLLSALPSEPLQAGMFEFALHSWFHVYIAFCTAVSLYLLALGDFSVKRLCILGAAAATLGIPILAQAVRGAMFLDGDMLILDQISEMQSPFSMLLTTPGLTETVGYYSWLLLGVPLCIAGFAYAALRTSKDELAYFSVWAVFGLSLLLMQFRMHYFGMLFMLLGPLLLLQMAVRRFDLAPASALLSGLIAFLLLYQPPLRQRLFSIYATSGDSAYEAALPAFEHLAELCREHPGIVLANNNDGNAILYHTECSVFVNNFIMRPQDELKLRLFRTLLGASPQAILDFEPEIDYLFLRALDFSTRIDDVQRLDLSFPLARELIAPQVLPEAFKASRTLMYESAETGEPTIFGKVITVTHSTN
jgi:hypothetical protein